MGSYFCVGLYCCLCHLAFEGGKGTDYSVHACAAACWAIIHFGLYNVCACLLLSCGMSSVLHMHDMA